MPIEGGYVECNPGHVIAALDRNVPEREIMEATIAMYHELKLCAGSASQTRPAIAMIRRLEEIRKKVWLNKPTVDLGARPNQLPVTCNASVIAKDYATQFQRHNRPQAARTGLQSMFEGPQ